ncbi:MAG: GNAT family N-acetyltransferase [Methanosarcinales archaeon]|nr:GNAT family N-acetyltransferase [Methanosarcinales archaeon]
MEEGDQFVIQLVEEWEVEPIVELYRAGGWWKESMDPSRIPELIRSSFLFAVAVDRSCGRSVGMGRVISDGMADAYIQDLLVLPGWRMKGIGSRIVSMLVKGCRSRGIAWIGLIAEPGTDGFYRSMGFSTMAGYVPMLLPGE